MSHISPVYVISKGRSDACLTARFLVKDRVPFRLVIEPQEYEAYAARFDPSCLLVLPFSNLGKGSIPARNFVWEHSKDAGDDWHWILDDNIRFINRLYRGKRIRVNSGIAFQAIEDFVNRYENVAIGGMNYSTFVGLAASGTKNLPPFYLNTHVYSCLLIRNELPYRWRGRYNEDTDLCLQVLSHGWCTVAFNAFSQQKMATMTMKGGNTAELYKGDGRLRMARSLEEAWPYAVTVKRRFNRPQHIVHDAWRKFDTQLIRRKDINWDDLPEVNEYGMKLVQAADQIKSGKLKSLLQDYNADS